MRPRTGITVAALPIAAGKTSGICALPNVMPAPVGTALEAGSSQIAQLPPWPAGLPVLDTAGDLPQDQLIITAVLAVIRANIAPPCSAPQMFAAAEAKEHFSASSPGYSKTIRPGASDPVCDGTWALASVSRPNVGGTDGFTLFRAQDGAWAEVADVGGVPADCILEEQGVPATVARVLWPPAQSAPASICQQ